MNLKITLEALISIRVAGFTLTKSNSIGTDDGSCWNATLTWDKQPLVEVSNGGYGGPDDVRYAVGANLPDSTVGQLLAKFRALPAVQQHVKEYKIDFARLCQKIDKLSEEELAKKIEQIADSTVDVSEEDLGMVVGWMADVYQTVKSMKRQVKSKVIVIEADDVEGNYVMYKAADTPANREKIKGLHTKPIASFAADLIAQL